MKQLGVNVNDYTAKLIDVIAKNEGISRSQVIRNAVAWYIAEHKRIGKIKKNKKPKKSIEDLFKG